MTTRNDSHEPARATNAQYRNSSRVSVVRQKEHYHV
jgi:hypothetical protein